MVLCVNDILEMLFIIIRKMRGSKKLHFDVLKVLFTYHFLLIPPGIRWNNSVFYLGIVKIRD